MSDTPPEVEVVRNTSPIPYHSSTEFPSHRAPHDISISLKLSGSSIQPRNKKTGSVFKASSSSFSVDNTLSPLYEKCNLNVSSIENHSLEESLSPKRSPSPFTHCHKSQLTPVICNSKNSIALSCFKQNSNISDNHSNEVDNSLRSPALNLFDTLNNTEDLSLRPRVPSGGGNLLSLSYHNDGTISNYEADVDDTNRTINFPSCLHGSIHMRSCFLEDSCLLEDDTVKSKESGNKSSQCSDHTEKAKNTVAVCTEPLIDGSTFSSLTKPNLDTSAHSYSCNRDSRYHDLLKFSAMKEDDNDPGMSQVKQYQPSRDSTLVTRSEVKQEDLDDIFVTSPLDKKKYDDDNIRVSYSSTAGRQIFSIPSINRACEVQSLEDSVCSLNTDYEDMFLSSVGENDNDSLSSYGEKSDSFNVRSIYLELNNSKVNIETSFQDELGNISFESAKLHQGTNCDLRGDKCKIRSKLTTNEESKAYEWLRTVEVGKDNKFVAEAASSKFLTGKIVPAYSKVYSSETFNKNKIHAKTIEPSAIFLPRETSQHISCPNS